MADKIQESHEAHRSSHVGRRVEIDPLAPELHPWDPGFHSDPRLGLLRGHAAVLCGRGGVLFGSEKP